MHYERKNRSGSKNNGGQTHHKGYEDIPVNAILRALAEGMRVEELLEDYPQLTKEDIKEALLYSAKVVGSEDIFPVIVGRVKKGAEVSGG